jgi:hypothetical protein
MTKMSSMIHRQLLMLSAYSGRWTQAISKVTMQRRPQLLVQAHLAVLVILFMGYGGQAVGALSCDAADVSLSASSVASIPKRRSPTTSRLFGLRDSTLVRGVKHGSVATAQVEANIARLKP